MLNNPGKYLVRDELFRRKTGLTHTLLVIYKWKEIVYVLAYSIP